MSSASVLDGLTGTCSVLHPKIFAITGTIFSALLLRHLLHQHSVLGDKPIKQTRNDIRSSTCLTDEQIETAIQTLIGNGFIARTLGQSKINVFQVVFSAVNAAIKSGKKPEKFISPRYQSKLKKKAVDSQQPSSKSELDKPRKPVFENRDSRLHI